MVGWADMAPSRCSSSGSKMSSRERLRPAIDPADGVGGSDDMVRPFIASDGVGRLEEFMD